MAPLASDGTPPQRDGWLRAHLDSPQVARVVYGAIIGLALIVSLQGHPPRAAAVAGSLIGTALAVALAEVYADILGSETRSRHRVRRAQVRHFAGDATAVAFGVAFPSAFFILAALEVMKLDTAFTLAKWTGVGLIGCYGYAAGRLAGGSRRAAALQGLGVAAIGGIVIAVKALVH
jgi:hypothetical protein